MNYMLLIAETQADFDKRSDPARAAALGEAWKAYSDALRKAGVFVRGSGLQPPQTATTVRVRDGKRQVQDGPFAESKELIGSVIVIDVPNLDEALEWAARCPVAAWGAIEVRPVWTGAAEAPLKPGNEIAAKEHSAAKPQPNHGRTPWGLIKGGV